MGRVLHASVKPQYWEKWSHGLLLLQLFGCFVKKCLQGCLQFVRTQSKEEQLMLS